jgi:preprotein translocase subunit YajC
MYEFLLALPPTDTPPAAPGSGGGLGSMLPMLLLMGVVFYFFLIRPANKKEKTRRAMLKSLKKHDRVVTSGGIHGTVTTIDDKQETVTVEVAQGIRMRFTRAAIHAIDKPSEARSGEADKKNKAGAKS